MKSQGNSIAIAAREIVSRRSSSGWRSSSSTDLGNSGNSSRNKTPLWASEISPGPGMLPPPAKPADEMVWCGVRKGRVPRSGRSAGSSPAILWIWVTSSASSKDGGGRMLTILRASIVLPEPGGPSINRLCPPAAATSSARLTCSWPLTSCRSSPSCWCCWNKETRKIKWSPIQLAL